MATKTSSAPSKKVASKKPATIKKETAAKLLIEIEGGDDQGEGGKIRNILRLYAQGMKPKEIIALGYNKNTVYVQTGSLKKLQRAPNTEYYGQPTWEANVQALMRKKKISRIDAVKRINAAFAELMEDDEIEGEE